MANFYGETSKYLLKRKRLEKVAALCYLCIAIIAVLITIWLVSSDNYSVKRIFAVVVVFGPITYWIYRLIKNEEYLLYSFWSGLRGEVIVAEELNKLNSSYYVFQDCVIPPGGKGNIDFVVIGPTGLFAIEVKNNPGKIDFDGTQITVNGKSMERDVLRQTMGEALALNDYFKNQTGKDIFIYPVLVFSNKFAEMKFGMKPIKNVSVVKTKWLRDVITQRPVCDVDTLALDILMSKYS